MSFNNILLPLGAALILGCTTVPVHPASDGASVLIGSLKGTLHEPPRSFLGNSPQVGGARGSVEFKGFKLVGRDNGKEFSIRPLRDSFFRQTLPPGEYDLVRKRRDRPSYKEDKSIRILTFTVPENALVNLGTLKIVLEGPPDESLFSAFEGSKGTYTYRYRYERTSGTDAMNAPLEWFSGKHPGAAAQYTREIVEITDTPTNAIDSSRHHLGGRIFRMLFDQDLYGL